MAPKTPLRNFSMTLKVTAPDGKETEPVLPRESDEPPSSTVSLLNMMSDLCLVFL